MTRFPALVLSAALAAAPLHADDRADDRAEDGARDMGEGLSLMEEGARLLLRGLMAEMEPTLRELEGLVEDLNAYHPPEILPNGDIILRRKEPLEEPPAEAEDPSGPVDL